MTTPDDLRTLAELLTRADSYLSLLWHRHVPPDRKDIDLCFDVDRTIGDLRKASEHYRALAAAQGTQEARVAEGPTR